MTTTRAIVIGLGLLLGAAPVSAHHAFSAEFDVSRPITLQGTLVKWEMINPHSWFHLDVKNPDGKVVRWMIEGGSPNQLMRLGVTKKTLVVGTEITIEGYQARGDPDTARGVGKNFILADGQRLFLGGSTLQAPGSSTGK
jgi:uncharacterized protein DUF6152